jgi:hypothetical protein
MNIYENIHSNLYSIVDKVIKEVAIPFYAKSDERETVKNISNYFDSGEIKVFLVIERRKPNLNEVNGLTTNDKENKEITITLIRRDFPGTVSTIRHEITHALDFIQGNQMARKQKKGYFKSFDSYMLDTMEFNEFIHNYKQMFDMVKMDSEKLPPIIKHVFKRTKTKEDFLLLMREAFNPVVARAVKGNKDLYRKIIERLAREKMLPPKFNK